MSETVKKETGNMFGYLSGFLILLLGIIVLCLIDGQIWADHIITIYRWNDQGQYYYVFDHVFDTKIMEFWYGLTVFIIILLFLLIGVLFCFMCGADTLLYDEPLQIMVICLGFWLGALMIWLCCYMTIIPLAFYLLLGMIYTIIIGIESAIYKNTIKPGYSTPKEESDVH